LPGCRIAGLPDCRIAEEQQYAASRQLQGPVVAVYAESRIRAAGALMLTFP